MEMTINKKNGFQSLYTHGEEIFNAVSHIVGGAIGIAVCILGIIIAYPSVANMTSIAIFGICVIILYTMSALYHFLPSGKAKGVFRIFDHCTIYLLIAGTYTPVCVIALGFTPVGIAVLVGEWVCAAAGITMNAISMKNKFVKVLSMVLYIVMGWAAIAIYPIIINTLPAIALWLLLAGGIAYTGGIVFYALGKKVRYFHSVWHLFDLAGTILQFISIIFMII